jgi:hypothetical protein
MNRCRPSLFHPSTLGFVEEFDVSTCRLDMLLALLNWDSIILRLALLAFLSGRKLHILTSERIFISSMDNSSHILIFLGYWFLVLSKYIVFRGHLLYLIKYPCDITYREQSCMNMRKFLVILSISSCHFNHIS